MIDFFKKGLSWVSGKYLASCVAVAGAVSSATVFAEGETTSSALNSVDISGYIDFSSIISDLTAQIMPLIGVAIGLSISIWVARLIWGKIRSVMSR